MQFLLLHKDAADFKLLTYPLSELALSTRPSHDKNERFINHLVHVYDWRVLGLTHQVKKMPNTDREFNASDERVSLGYTFEKSVKIIIIILGQNIKMVFWGQFRSF